MPFDQSSITSGPVATRLGPEVTVQWASSAPAGSVFQLYVDGSLVWAGTARRAVLPGNLLVGALIQVGVVPAAERSADHGPTLPDPDGTGRRPRLDWYGGTYLSPTLRGFRIYRGGSPGEPVDYSSPVAEVPAYPRGSVLDGFGMGPFGYGGFGLSASSYRWFGPPLADGTWHFGIVPFDRGGLAGAAREESVVIAAAPDPPAGLSYSYDAATGQVTLTWS